MLLAAAAAATVLSLVLYWDSGGGTAVCSAVAAAACLRFLLITEVRQCCVCVRCVLENIFGTASMPDRTLW